MASNKQNLSIGRHLRDAWHRIGSRRVPSGTDTADAGMSTAEYAIGTVAACAFAAVLYKVITSTEVLNLLSSVVTRALHVPF
jgi:TRAP-type uncharacterized transport system fused permease subunit